LNESHFVELFVVFRLQKGRVLVFNITKLEEEIEPFYFIVFQGVEQSIFQVFFHIFLIMSGMMLIYIKISVYIMKLKFVFVYKFPYFSFTLAFLILRPLANVKVNFRILKFLVMKISSQVLIESGAEMVIVFVVIVRVVLTVIGVKLFPMFRVIFTLRNNAR